MNIGRIVLLTLLTALVAIDTTSLVRGQESANYSMGRVSLTAVAGTASSSSFETSILVGAELPAGAMSQCNTGFATGLGFWSLRAGFSVPMQLLLEKNGVDPLIVGLRWSGDEDEFEVYRSELVTDVLNPANLSEITPLCTSSDDQATSADLVLYNVIPHPQSARGVAPRGEGQ